MLSADDADVHAAAHALVRLPPEITEEVDAGLLAALPYFGVRQAAAVLAVRQPDRNKDTAMRLANDPDVQVRRVLAAEAARMAPDSSGTLVRILSMLAEDPRHSIRMAAAVASTVD